MNERKPRGEGYTLRLEREGKQEEGEDSEWEAVMIGQTQRVRGKSDIKRVGREGERERGRKNSR